ncbi:MAG: phosphoglycerate transporter protein PgtP [Parachlamydiales bacterium]
MFGIFKPAPHKEPIKDRRKVRKAYRYWQIRIMIGMYVGYALYYFTRKNLVIALPGMMENLHYTMTDLGWVLSLWSIMYAVSKFTSGMLADRSNPRTFMAVGLIATGALNLIFGTSASIWMLGIIWGLNGWFQGWGWPPSGRLLMHWYSQKERGRWWALWNTSHNVGGALIPLLAGWAIAIFGGWQWAFYIPGIVGIIGGTFLLWSLRDTPQSLGLPSIEEYSGEESQEVAKEHERELSVKEILFKYVLSNRYIWLLAFASFFVYVVRQAVNDWTPTYLMQSQGYGTTLSGLFVTMFEVGGLCGSLAAGWLSDLVFRGRRGPVNVFFGLGIVGSVAAFYFLSGLAPWIGLASMFCMGFFIFGPQMMIGMAAAELSHKKAVATATGFAGFFAYIGASVAGAPIAAIQGAWGWGGYFLTVAACSALVVALLLPTWSARRREETQLEEAAEVA